MSQTQMTYTEKQQLRALRESFAQMRKAHDELNEWRRARARDVSKTMYRGKSHAYNKELPFEETG
jgi:hypothetical protein